MLVRARLDGVMHPLRVVPSDLQQAVTTRLKIMGELDIAERRAPQDGRVSIKFGGEPIDIRIAVLPITYGEQVVLRILYRTARSLDFTQLGMAEDTADTLRHAIKQPYGCVITVGPTGSGKTTTLYAALDMLNDPGRVVMTIEDPVEFQLEGINQIQVNPKAGLTFAQGLRTVLRSDPDVLLVGEIRDTETARIAIQAAMTGHLVLTTLHADNVASSVSRMRDMGVDSSLFASTLNCIFSQRLARKLCLACCEAYEADADLLREAGFDPPDGETTFTLHRPRGCIQCSGGYKGRIGLYETLRVTPEMRRLIETATAEEIYSAAVERGMRTLQQDGLRLALAGHTSLEEVERVAGERRL
jgi:type IV pilus assembly protein PilB